MSSAATREQYDWALGNDTGTSSMTIWSVMTGVNPRGWNLGYPPADPGDFGRCYRLLKRFPGWRKRLDEVAARYPEWGPKVQHWDTLTALYEQESPSGEAPLLYDLMKRLEVHR